MKRLFLISVLLLILASGFARGRTCLSGGTVYYVSNSGSDSNDGTSTGTPWKTIAHVNAHAFNPGDSVLFQAGGIWREVLTFPSSGSAGNVIIIKSYGSGAVPIISGADLLDSGWTNSSGNVWRVTVTTQPNQVFFNGKRGTLKASIVAITDPSQWYWASNVLYVYSTSNPATAFTNPGIEASVRNEAIDVSQNYVTISGIHATKSNSATMGGFVINGNHATISENLSDCNVSAGIRVWNNSTQDILITGNETAHNGQGIYTYRHSAAAGHEVIVQYNNVHDNTSVGGIGDGIGINGDYWIVQYNWLHGNGDPAADCIGIHIYSTDKGPGWGQNNIVRYNLISGQIGKGDGSGIELDKYTSANQIYYNVVTGSYGPGIDIYDSSNVIVYGNSLYGNVRNTAFPYPAELIFTGPLGLLTGAVCKNNAVYATGSSEYAVYLDSQTAKHAPRFMSNVWYAPNSSKWYYNGRPGNNVSTWNALRYVTRDNYADPLFCNGPSNLSLKSGSPAIDAGADLGSIYHMGLAPGSAWPSSVSLLNQNSHGTGWEVGAYVHP